MSKIIQVSNQDDYSVRNTTVSGFNTTLYATASAVNNALVLSDFNLDNIVVTVKLNRMGKQFILAQGSIFALSIVSNFETTALTNLRSNTFIVLQSQAVAVKNIIEIPLAVDFRSPINLRGSDYLTISVNFASSAIGTNVSSVSNETYIRVEEINTVGLEYFTPSYNVTTIESGQATPKYFLGDSIQDVYFVNTDKLSILYADRVIDSYDIQSNICTLSTTYFTMLAQRRRVNVGNNVDFQFQTFKLMSSDVPCKNVSINMNLISSNVATGKNYLISLGSYSDARLVELATTTKELTALSLRQRLGYNVDSRQISNISSYKNTLLLGKPKGILGYK